MKLYKCTYTLVYYAAAENESDAAFMVTDALRNEVSEEDDVTVHEVTRRGEPLASGWTEKALVYTETGEAITLAEMLARLPHGGQKNGKHHA